MAAERCPQCGFENPPGMKFCGECGTPMPRRCPHCGAEPASGHTSCVECGTLLTGPASMAKLTQEPEMVGATASAERRQLTVLFCDLADSTALSSQLDPEDWSDVLRGYQERCAREIHHFGGHIARYFGDGLLVYFGYPQAHEDDPHRAVRAALGIVKAMQPLNVRLQQDRGIAALAVRLGIHTGLVVVGEMGGGDFRVNMAVGDTPNIAARLQALAAPDAVVVSATTYQLTEGFFACEALGSHALKGIARPLAVYRVWQETGAQSRVERAGLTPLVAREQEVTLLLDRWRQVQAGVGQVVSLSGEAGIGKSRLVRVLREHLAPDTHHVLECHGSPYYQHSALHPVIDMVERALRFGPMDSAPERIGRLEALLREYGAADPQLVPLFAGLLDLPLAGRHAPVDLAPWQLRQRTMDAVVQLLIAAARQSPLLFIVEDLHWVDPSTLELLGVLLEQQTSARILTLLTFRPEFMPAWAVSAQHVTLALERLPREHVEVLVTRVAGGKTLPADVCRQVVARTDGIPLFVEELTKTVLESGLLRERENHYELAGPLPPLAIPATLHDSLMARLDRLAAVKEVAQLGATIGRDFSYELLHAIAPLDPATLQHALARLVDAELLHQRGTPPLATYGFRHALIQEAAYQSLLKSRRQQWHQRILRVLEQRFPETAETHAELPAPHSTDGGSDQIEQLGYHAFHGGVWEKAATYLRRAGTRALARSADREAIACLEQALEAVRNLPETPATLEQAIDLYLELRNAWLVLNELRRIPQCLAGAEAAARALGDARRTAWVSLYAGQLRWFTGESPDARRFAEQAVSIAEAFDDRSLRITGTIYAGSGWYNAGDYRRARDTQLAALELLRTEPVHQRQGHQALPIPMAHAHVARACADLGDFEEGIRHGREAIRLAESVGHRYSLLLGLYSLGELYLVKHDLDEAIPLLERAFAIESDLAHWPRSAAPLGHAYALAGRIAEGMALLERQRGAMDSVGRGVQKARVLEGLAHACLLGGRVNEAERFTDQALALTRQRGERGVQARVLRLLGEIAFRRAADVIEPAAERYRQALALATELGMRPLMAHCHRGLARLFEQAPMAGAEDHLARATALYREMQMMACLPPADAISGRSGVVAQQ
jgi:class 3 adenylate cyclase/tetratricopeptide (TPR) repeat protein